jgi:hypothetical protein
MSFNSNNNNNSNNEDSKRRTDIAEDLPAMRSVMIGGAIPAMPLRRTMHEPLVKGVPFGTKLPPAIQLIPTPSVKPTAYDNIATTSATVDAAAACRWQVTAALAVPSYYDFERTHARVKGVAVLEVSKRIDDCLRAESIAATFDNEQVRHDGELMCWMDEGTCREGVVSKIDGKA